MSRLCTHTICGCRWGVCGTLRLLFGVCSVQATMTRVKRMCQTVTHTYVTTFRVTFAKVPKSTYTCTSRIWVADQMFNKTELKHSGCYQVYRHSFYLYFICLYALKNCTLVRFQFLFTGETDRRTTDGQTQLLNPALCMHIWGNKRGTLRDDNLFTIHALVTNHYYVQ